MLCTPERPNPGNLKQQSFSDNSESVHKYWEMKPAVALFFPVRPGLNELGTVHSVYLAACRLHNDPCRGNIPV